MCRFFTLPFKVLINNVVENHFCYPAVMVRMSLGLWVCCLSWVCACCLFDNISWHFLRSTHPFVYFCSTKTASFYVLNL